MPEMSRATFDALRQFLAPYMTNAHDRDALIISAYYRTALLLELQGYSGSAVNFMPFLIQKCEAYGDHNDQPAIIAVLDELANGAAGGQKATIDRLKAQVLADMRPAPVARVAAPQQATTSAPQPKPSRYAVEWVVDARGRGDYSTISAALNAAPPNARIVVKAGVYQEGIVLTKTVTLEGDGGTVIVENNAGSVIMMETDEATVAGLTIRCTATTNVYGVDIPQGRLILRECDVTSSARACIAVRNAGTRPTIVDCTIHNGNQAGVLVYENARGMIENCQIFANAQSGIEIFEGGNPTVRGCTIRDGKNGGVLVYANGAGIIENCQIFTNEMFEIVIQTGNPTVRGCTIRDGEGFGVSVNQNGVGVIENCQIFANAYAGIAISAGGNPTVRGCTITQNGYEAVWASDNGRGTFEDCDLRGNTYGAWNIDDTSYVIQRNNRE
jgi:parallel beta-helix repeat protein